MLYQREQERTTHFWKRWCQEYLTELRESHRYHHGKTKPDPVTVGEAEFIHEDGTPRSFWKLGRVIKLIVGPDGKPRGAVLKVGQYYNSDFILDIIHHTSVDTINCTDVHAELSTDLKYPRGATVSSCSVTCGTTASSCTATGGVTASSCTATMARQPPPALQPVARQPPTVL